MLSSGLGIVGFSWAASPVCTELETIIMNWIGQMSGLPENLLPFDEKKKIKNYDKPLKSNDMASSIVNKEDINNNLSDDESNDASLCAHSTTGGGVLLVNISKV
jgi:hypothetical protein